MKLSLLGFAERKRFERTILARISQGQLCYINYGCGLLRCNHMINLDGWRSSATDFVFDLRQKLCCPSNIVDGIYSEHFLEHIDYLYAVRILREFFRILRPGGCIRLVLPDLLTFSQAYLDDNVSFFKACYQFTPSTFPELEIENSCQGLNSIFYNHSHKYIWDFPSLRSALIDIGFSVVNRCSWRSGSNNMLLIDSNAPGRSLQSFYLEAFK